MTLCTRYYWQIWYFYTYIMAASQRVFRTLYKRCGIAVWCDRGFMYLTGGCMCCRLRRYLVAREWDVTAAENQLRETLEWRHVTQPQHVVCQACIKTVGSHAMVFSLYVFAPFPHWCSFMERDSKTGVDWKCIAKSYLLHTEFKYKLRNSVTRKHVDLNDTLISPHVHYWVIPIPIATGGFRQAGPARVLLQLRPV